MFLSHGTSLSTEVVILLSPQLMLDLTVAQKVVPGCLLTVHIFFGPQYLLLIHIYVPTVGHECDPG